VVGFELSIGVAVWSNSINFGESLSKHARQDLARTHVFRKARRGLCSTTTVPPSFVDLFPAPRSTCNPYEARQTTFYSYIILRRFR
jgi:hypothetical protein